MVLVQRVFDWFKLKFNKLLCKCNFHNLQHIANIDALHSKMQCNNCKEYFLFKKISGKYIKYTKIIQMYEKYYNTKNELKNGD